MILDPIDNLTLSDEEAKKHEYACEALARLAEGLFWINEEITRIEKYTRSRAKQQNIQISARGEFLDNVPLGVISCAFQWYAVSIYNYAQLVGWLIYQDTKQAKNYVHGVLPNIAKYRNKVAAHFAITDKRDDDNEGSLTASVITNIIYAASYFYAGSISPKTIDGKEVDESNIQAWSVTLAHQQLVKRFWPIGKAKSSSAIMIPSGDTLNIAVKYYKSPL